MNNQKKVFYSLCATLLWSVNFVIARIKDIPPVGMALEMDNCVLAFCHKSTLRIVV
jgi:hypothetical protein